MKVMLRAEGAHREEECLDGIERAVSVRCRRISGAVGLDEHSFPHSRRFSHDLLEEAIEVFQKHTERTLTLEDARQMLET